MVYSKLRCLVILLQQLGRESVSVDGHYTIKAHPVEMSIVKEVGTGKVIQDRKVLQNILDGYKEFTVCTYKHAESITPAMVTDDCLVLSEHKMSSVFMCTVHANSTSGIVVIDTHQRVIVGENDEIVGAFVSVIKAL